MKRMLAAVLSLALCAGMLAGCSSQDNGSSTADGGNSSKTSEPAQKVELNVVTTYGGNDGNVQNWLDASKAWQEKTGNTIKDGSGTANEDFKAQVATDFTTGAEPDVLFYFNSGDSNAFVKAGKVVDIETIRGEFPDFANNMDDAKLQKCASPVDGKVYAVPTYGFWEGMFVNTAVLAEAGVSTPGADYTMEQFIKDCEKIKAAGKTPIAASLHEIPHYWFEFMTYNHLSPATHTVLPKSVDDTQGKAWADGINDIKALFEKKFFPSNTLSMSDEEAQDVFYAGEAAFLIDGSWRLGTVKERMGDKADNVVVTFPPSLNQDRKTTDILAGISSGYYITQKCWEDPNKRAAAVDLISYLTSDEQIAEFAKAVPGSTTALKKAPAAPADMDKVTTTVFDMQSKVTGFTGAVQDLLAENVRSDLFASVKFIVSGEKTPAQAIQAAIDAQAEADQ